jgi:hypothetical protein
LIYAGAYAVLLLAGGLSIGRAQARRSIYFLTLAVLFIFVAFRDEVGCDWTGYFNIYAVQGASTMAEALLKREPLFWAANALLHIWHLDYPYINVIAAAVYFFGYHALARRQPDPLGFLILSFPLLIMNLAMSGIRQAMAVGILCFAFNAFSDRKLAAYVVLVSLAGGFHTSALIFLAFAPFVRGGNAPSSLLISSVIAFPGLFLLASGEEFAIYFTRYVQSGVEALGAPFRAGLLSLTGLVFFMFLRDRWRHNYPKDYKLVYVQAAAMIAVFPLVLISSVIADRVGYYLMPLQLVILTRLGYLVRDRLIPAVPYAAGAAVLIAWISLSALFEICYVPYGNWLFG